jgi:hypothetical protein
MQKEVNTSDCTFEFLLVYTESLAKSTNISDINSQKTQLLELAQLTPPISRI